jgi:hypothetical protein
MTLFRDDGGRDGGRGAGGVPEKDDGPGEGVKSCGGGMARGEEVRLVGCVLGDV